jgi:hypothetical protein
MSSSGLQMELNITFDDFNQKASIYMQVYLESLNDSSKWQELNIASAGLLKCLAVAVVNNYPVPEQLKGFFKDGINEIYKYQRGALNYYPLLNQEFNLQSGKRIPPITIDSSEIFLNLIASFLYGMYLGKKQKIDNLVPRRNLYINPYLDFLRGCQKKHGMTKSEMNIFDCKYVRSGGTHTSYINKINNNISLKSFAVGYFNGLNEIGDKAAISIDRDDRKIHLNLSVVLLSEMLHEITSENGMLRLLNVNDIRKLIRMYMYQGNENCTRVINSMPDEKKNRALLIGTSFSDYMITGVDFAALNSLPAQVLSNWAKNTSQLQLLVSREMVFFDSFIMKNMNCFEFDIDKKTRHEWSGLGEPPKELKVVAQKTQKPYTDIIRYTRIK